MLCANFDAKLYINKWLLGWYIPGGDQCSIVIDDTTDDTTTSDDLIDDSGEER